jgi:hypothetical protein
MVVHDAAIFPGIVLTCRIIGILQIEQKSKGKTERNDRLFAVPKDSHSEQALKDVRDLSKPIQQELENFSKRRTSLRTRNSISSAGRGRKRVWKPSKMPPSLSKRTASDRYAASALRFSLDVRLLSQDDRATGQGRRPPRFQNDGGCYRTSSISALCPAISTMSPGPHVITARARGET